MKGTIVVGKDTVTNTVDAFSARSAGTKATISFKLNEAAVGHATSSRAPRRGP